MIWRCSLNAVAIDSVEYKLLSPQSLDPGWYPHKSRYQVKCVEAIFFFHWALYNDKVFVTITINKIMLSQCVGFWLHDINFIFYSGMSSMQLNTVLFATDVTYQVLRFGNNNLIHISKYTIIILIIQYYYKLKWRVGEQSMKRPYAVVHAF